MNISSKRGERAEPQPKPKPNYPIVCATSKILRDSNELKTSRYKRMNHGNKYGQFFQKV